LTTLYTSPLHLHSYFELRILFLHLLPAFRAFRPRLCTICGEVYYACIYRIRKNRQRTDNRRGSALRGQFSFSLIGATEGEAPGTAFGALVRGYRFSHRN
jgi:hypothetical protein